MGNELSKVGSHLVAWSRPLFKLNRLLPGSILSSFRGIQILIILNSREDEFYHWHQTDSRLLWNNKIRLSYAHSVL